MPYEVLNVQGREWTYFFAKSDGVLTPRGRRELVGQAIEFYMDDAERRTIIGNEYAGVLERPGKRLNLGTLVGEMIEGEIETNMGQKKVIFGITELRADPNMN